MGDRANVEVREGKNSVFLYTHWSGTELPELVQKALKRKQRWEDSSYLARIVFCTMMDGHIDEETGFGISSTVGDGDDRVIVLDTDAQQVRWKGKSKSFEEFAEMPKIGW